MASMTYLTLKEHVAFEIRKWTLKIVKIILNQIITLSNTIAHCIASMTYKLFKAGNSEHVILGNW